MERGRLLPTLFVAAALAAAMLGGCVVGTDDEAGAGRALTMPQPPSVPMFCGAQTCGEGEACCRATGECYQVTCIGCCPTELPPIVTYPRLGPDSGIEPQLRLPGHLPVPIPLPLPAPTPAPR